MKRWLFLVHRWLGVALCLLMAMWFASGIVMMYVGYPKLGDAERLARLPPLDASPCCVGPSSALERAGLPADAIDRLRLTTIAGRPHYVVAAGRAGVIAIDALDGRAVREVGPTKALAAAAAFAGGAEVEYLDRTDEDAWTHSRALDAHRPLHRVQVRDAAATILYVSSRTGEVVRDATRTERLWNYAGAWLHWLYPLRGGALDAAWHGIMVWTSVLATLLALAGAIVGALRWRFAGRYASGARSPYRERWMRRHHLAGMAFGVLAVTWIFSGLMSMNPWKLFGAGPGRLDERAYRAGVPDLAGIPRDAAIALAHLETTGFAARELEWRLVDGVAFIIGVDQSGRTRAIAVGGDTAPFAEFPAGMLERAGARLVPGAQTLRMTRLDAYDLYYYARAPHTMLGQQDRRLPVLRLEFDDPDRTWVHVDPGTARVLGRLDARQRVKRWLFAMLHSWDWLPLLERRPLWDALLLAASAGGLALSVSGAVIGWRRLRRRATLRTPRARSCRSSGSIPPRRAPRAGSPR